MVLKKYQLEKLDHVIICLTTLLGRKTTEGNYSVLEENKMLPAQHLFKLLS